MYTERSARSPDQGVGSAQLMSATIVTAVLCLKASQALKVREGAMGPWPLPATALLSALTEMFPEGLSLEY